ncbi:MAG TPA: SDR family NAD(P)-dependent oxidoreductase [Stellaceae bacterium]|jgi:NAD(P)-dependent dehydrogenase (short-subunit alcohol dehydrogenase family)
MRFTDRVALITAVASGIGRATADIMGREGAIIVGVDNNEARLEQAMEEIRAAGGRAQGWVCDALDPQQVRDLVDAVVKEHGRIDILVNAVGGSTIIDRPGRPMHELSLDDWEKLIQFNLNGTFLFTNAVVPAMQKQGSGKIVNLASIAGRGRSVSSSAAYATAKGGIIAFTKKLSYELGPYGININAIAPSVTLTERIRPHWERRSQEAKAAEIDKTPLRRVAEAVDQARVICFLASADADFVTGETIDVTGGGS